MLSYLVLCFIVPSWNYSVWSHLHTQGCLCLTYVCLAHTEWHSGMLQHQMCGTLPVPSSQRARPSAHQTTTHIQKEKESLAFSSCKGCGVVYKRCSTILTDVCVRTHTHQLSPSHTHTASHWVAVFSFCLAWKMTEKLLLWLRSYILNIPINDSPPRPSHISGSFLLTNCKRCSQRPRQITKADSSAETGGIRRPSFTSDYTHHPLHKHSVGRVAI